LRLYTRKHWNVREIVQYRHMPQALMTDRCLSVCVEDESEAQTCDFSSWKLEQTAPAGQRTGQYINSPMIHASQSK